MADSIERLEKVRACIKCREYLPIYPSNPVNLNHLRIFESQHHLHTVVTIAYIEVRDLYKRVKA